MKQKTLARINGKDVCDDWIYEEIFSDGYVRTPFHRNKTNDVIGFYHGYLLSAHWVDDGSTVEFNFIDYPCAIVNGDIINQFVNYLNETNGTDSPDLRSEVKVNGTQIKVTFYWGGRSMLKIYRVSVDITMSKDTYVYAENEEAAKKNIEKDVEKNSYYYAGSADSFVNCEVTDIMEEEIH